MAECRIKRNSRRAVKISKRLADLSGSGVTRCELDREFVLSWHQTADLKHSIHEIIDRSMHQYFQEAGGTLLAYDKVQWLQPAAVVHGSDPGISVKVRVQYYVFRPCIDAILSGTVAYLTSTHVVCKVYGIVSARIMFAAEEAMHFKIGDPIWFRVRRYRAHHRYIMLDGVAVSKEEAIASGYSCPYGCKVNILAKAQKSPNRLNNLSKLFSIPMLPFPKAPNGPNASQPGSSRDMRKVNGNVEDSDEKLDSLVLSNGLQDWDEHPLTASGKRKKLAKLSQISADNSVADSPNCSALRKRVKSEYP
uniref:RPA43 OB domain-containing protein n=1 Tax=Trichuris muris TaxID=70415 RepID=A0A5S6QT79_TRIMR